MKQDGGEKKKTARGAKRAGGRAEAARGAKVQEPKPAASRESSVILEGLKKVGSGRKRSKALKAQGLSLGKKFALVISLVAASLCCLASFIVYFQAEKSLLAEIDRKGAVAVKSVGALGNSYYDRYMNLLDEEDNLPKEASKEDRAKQTNKINDRKYQLSTEYQKALETMVSIRVGEPGKEQRLYSEEMLNVCIHGKLPLQDIEAGAFNNTNEDSRFKFDNTGPFESYAEAIEGEMYESYIEVADGTLSSKADISRVRAYRVKVLPNEKLEAYVYISKKDIERTTNTVMFSIVLITIVAVVVAALISIFLARHVTHPLRYLIQDIEEVASGNLDHSTIVVSRDEIGILAATFNAMTKNLKVAHQTELERKAREYEMQIATDIQSNLLPSQIPKIEGYEIAAFYNPSKEVGGDYYDFLEIDSDHIGFIVADVSGKSIPGSMVMTMARALIRMLAFQTHSPAKMFSEVNRVLCKDIKKGMFVTSMYGLLKISTNEFTLSSAGHNPGIIWRAAEKKIELVNPKGMALGLGESILFNKTVHEQKYQLYPGDRVIFYTDGVTEAMSPESEEYGDERFYSLITAKGGEASNQLVNTLVETLDKWRRDCPQSDDITIVTFRKKTS